MCDKVVSEESCMLKYCLEKLDNIVFSNDGLDLDDIDLRLGVIRISNKKYVKKDSNKRLGLVYIERLKVEEL